MRSSLLAILIACLALNAIAADTLAQSGPAVTIALGSRHGHVTPSAQGFTHTGGGNIDVAQPTADTLVITMTGVAVAGSHPFKNSFATLNFDLEQSFAITFEKPEIKRAKLTIEGRIIGLLRSHCAGDGSAEQCPGTAAVSCGPVEILVLTVPAHTVSGGENSSINCREATAAASVEAGSYMLRDKWAITASHSRSLKFSKAASAEFAPDPALDPLWISYWEPFHGAVKKDFGLQITIKVVPDTEQPGQKVNRYPHGALQSQEALLTQNR